MTDRYQVSVSLADVRAEPGPASELVTQAVLATPAWRHGQWDGWTLVDLSDYSGWVRSTELVSARAAEGRPAVLVTALRTDGVVAGSGQPLVVYAGTRLPEIERSPEQVLAALPDGRTIRLAASAVRSFEPASPVERETAISALISFARRFLGTPYLWGGWTVDGIDCSGLVQLVYRIIDCPLPRDAQQQFAALSVDVPPTLVQPGDLVFFSEEDRVDHVGIFVGNGRYLHASGVAGRVLVSSLASPTSEVDRHYAARYRGARRVLAGA